MLADVMPRSKNSIVTNEPLARAIQHFMKLLREEKTSVTFHWFYNNKLRATYNGPKAVGSAYNYVRSVLRLDPTTGQSLV